jgi:hypothetical protein
MAAPCAFKDCFGLLSVGHPVLPWLGLFHFIILKGDGASKRKRPEARGLELRNTLRKDSTILAAERDNQMTLRAWGCSVDFTRSDWIWGRVVAGGRPPSFNSFSCPNCQALYHVVKVEAGPETAFHDVTCRACGFARFPVREGEFVVKYFLLRQSCRALADRRIRS